MLPPPVRSSPECLVHRGRLRIAVPDGPVPANSRVSGLTSRSDWPPSWQRVFWGWLTTAFRRSFRRRQPAAEGRSPPRRGEGQEARLLSCRAARSILDKHLAAIGGRQAVLGHKSTHAIGTLSMPAAGVTGASRSMAPSRTGRCSRSRSAASVKCSKGFDGTHGWSISPMTGRCCSKASSSKRSASIRSSTASSEARSRYVSLTTLEQVDFEGRSCYKVRLVRKTGGEDIEFYDVATGLKAGSITTRETQMGTVTGTTVETDYKKFGNLLQPTTVRSQVGGLQQVITITSVDYDNVPASVFELPRESRPF